MAAMSKRWFKVLPANSRIRVLVVDDSVVIRRLVTHALGEGIELEVVGTASNGVIALQRILQLKPDIVTLDIEMPELNGLDTLREIRRLYPDLPVIMFSTLTERGAGATLEALSLGASDYVTKAANVGSLDKSMLSLRSELVPKIRQFFQIGSTLVVPARMPPIGAATPKLVPAKGLPGKRITRSVVAIGVSTGGPTALATILPMFPKDFGLPILIVQHMPPMFTRLLAERLNADCAIRVEEAVEGMPIQAGKAVIAAGGHHMRIRRSDSSVVVKMSDEPPENSCRPAVDVTFRSVADVFGSGTIVVILTGMGQDGLRGTELLKGNGAYVIAQDESSSVVWGMPGSVVNAGFADSVVDLRCVVPEILKHV